MTGQAGLALITGGGSGIGLAIARALLRRGWSVAACGRDGARLERAASDLTTDDPAWVERLAVSPADVTRADEIRRWITEACERFGPPALLVNNAGVGGSGEIASFGEDEWDRLLDINLKGVFLCTREVLPRMRAVGGWIVNIASLSGKRGMVGSSAYCASKFGVVGFTETLAREEAKHNIRATAICPGYVATPMVAHAALPASEMIAPEDIARTVLYLLDLGPKATVREIVVERTAAL